MNKIEFYEQLGELVGEIVTKVKCRTWGDAERVVENGTEKGLRVERALQNISTFIEGKGLSINFKSRLEVLKIKASELSIENYPVNYPCRKTTKEEDVLIQKFNTCFFLSSK